MTNPNLSPALEVRLAIDLSDLTFKAGQKHAVIGRSQQELEDNDILGWSPSLKFQLVNQQANSHDWLHVDQKRHLIVFLCYSDSKTIFQDLNVWTFFTANARKKKMDPPLQHYLLSNLADIFFVCGTGAPGMNFDINLVLRNLLKF